MSADVLRAAATKLREAAEGATEGPWRIEADRVDTETGEGGETYVLASGEGYDEYVAEPAPEDATYIALANPAFGLAVADWLDATAARIEEIHESLPFSVRLTLSSLNVTAVEEALTVARSIVGDPS